MSELISKNMAGRDLRWQLRSTVSALTLLTALSAHEAKADQSDAPTVWIEVGGQLQRQSGQGDPVEQPFIANNPNSLAFRPDSPMQTEKAPLYSNGAEAKIIFEPQGTDWVFSAGIQYGRANGSKNTSQRAPEERLHAVYPFYKQHVGFVIYSKFETLTKVDFSDVQSQQHQSHAIIDFQAGKDVGLGLFGRGGTATLNLGVRIAQFISRSSGNIHALPDQQHFNSASAFAKSYFHSPNLYFIQTKHHNYAAAFHATRSFHGIGPTLSWNGSTPIVGKPETAEIAVDWGANAAVLFGKQRASGAHQTSGSYKSSAFHSTYTTAANFSRAKAVIVPNVGGFAGVSFLYANAKVSFGYRGDFFFGAMDAGVDARKSDNVGFYGPFASISVGLL